MVTEDSPLADLVRVPGFDDETWNSILEYLQRNPKQAQSLCRVSTSPEAVQGWLQVQALTEHLQAPPEDGEAEVEKRIAEWKQDPELAALLQDLKGGAQAASKYLENEDFLIKISQKLDSIGQELRKSASEGSAASLTLHEAAKRGELQAVQELLLVSKDVDTQDHRGVTPLGYAIGAGWTAVTTLLLEAQADVLSVDVRGNGGVHYAAGYGRTEILELLIQAGVSVNQVNAQGQTPLIVARHNQHHETVKVLEAQGAH